MRLEGLGQLKNPMTSWGIEPATLRLVAISLPGGKGRPARKADNLTVICEPILENVEASTSHNPMGLHGLLQG
jgi:hypothetical protein